MTLDELFRDYPRIVVTGGPITGKTIVTDARPEGMPLFHSDEVVIPNFSGDLEDKFRSRAATLVKLATPHERYIVAGVTAHIALKYGLPTDCIVLCTKYHGETKRLPGQMALSRQAESRSRQEAKSRNVPLIPFRGRNDYRWDGLQVN